MPALKHCKHEHIQDEIIAFFINSVFDDLRSHSPSHVLIMRIDSLDLISERT